MRVPEVDLQRAIKAAALWRYDPESDTSFLDMDGWYSDSAILTRLGGALAETFEADGPTVIVGPASSGYLLGALVAEHLKVPFIRAQKNPSSFSDSDRWRIRTTPPDYRDRHIRFGWRDRLVGSSDRVLAVDDLVDTGGQLLAIQAIVEDIGASWLGASVVIDNLTSHVTRRDLGVKGLVNGRDIR